MHRICMSEAVKRNDVLCQIILSMSIQKQQHRASSAVKQSKRLECTSGTQEEQLETALYFVFNIRAISEDQ